jgi:dipeptidyl aminopeptidase/acylaminoacyl peptidase
LAEVSAVAAFQLAFALLATVGLILIGANRLIRASLAAPRLTETGAPTGLPWRQVRIPTVRGKTLFGWFIPAAAGAPALAVVHGWGGNAEMMLPLAAPLHAAGYALLLFDARSHGASDGDNFASLPRFAEDLERAVVWLQARPEVDPRRVGVIGHSVGAGAALLLATRRQDLLAAVSLAAFAHPARMMRRWLEFKRIPFWPFGAYILWYVQRVIGYRFDDIAPCHTIREVNCPVLLAHGTEDDMVPVSEAREIWAARRDERVRLLLMPGSHDDYGEIERHIGTVIAFLDNARHAPLQSPSGVTN